MRWKYAAATAAVGAMIVMGLAQARISVADSRNRDLVATLAAYRARLGEPAPALLAMAQEPADPPRDAEPPDGPPAPPSPPEGDLLPPPVDEPSLVPADDLLPPIADVPPARAPRPATIEPPPSGRTRRPGPAAAPPPRASRPAAADQSPFDLEPPPSGDDRSPFGLDRGTPPAASDEEQERETRALARQLVEADADAAAGRPSPAGETLENWSKLLRVRLSSQFIQRQRRYTAEVDALQARVAKLRELIQRRQENSERIIDERIQQLKAEAQGMGW